MLRVVKPTQIIAKIDGASFMLRRTMGRQAGNADLYWLAHESIPITTQFSKGVESTVNEIGKGM